MSDSSEQYLHSRLLESQLKYSYFLLAAAGAAIAFALKQTETAPILLRQIPLGFAVGCWALSFYFGCKYLSWAHATLLSNAALHQIQRGTFTEFPLPPGEAAARFAEEEFRKITYTNAEGASWRAQWQFRLLIAGAIAYIVWHVLGMVARTA